MDDKMLCHDALNTAREWARTNKPDATLAEILAEAEKIYSWLSGESDAAKG